MNFADHKMVERLRAEFPVGCRIVLDKMDDRQAPPIGTQGTYNGVDDAGHLSALGHRKPSERFLRCGQLPPCGFGSRGQGVARPAWKNATDRLTLPQVRSKA